MSSKRIAAVTAAFVGVSLLSIAGAQAATHHMHHRVHHAPAAAVATEGVAVAGYYAPSAWGDFDCVPSFPGCRPYAAKDWSKP